MSTREQPRPSELEGHCVMLQVTHRRQPQDAGCHAPGLLWVINHYISAFSAAPIHRYFALTVTRRPLHVRLHGSLCSDQCHGGNVNSQYRARSFSSASDYCRANRAAFHHSGTKGPARLSSVPGLVCLFVGLLCLLSRVFLTSLASPARSLALPKESLRAPCEDNDAFCNLFDVLNGLEEGPICFGHSLIAFCT